MRVLALSSEAWAAIGVWVTLLPLSAFGIVQMIDARRVRHDTSRPFVVVELQNRSFLAILAIVNVGPMMARNVRARFPDGLDSTHGELRWLTSPAFDDGIANLAPHSQLRFWFDRFPQRKDAGLPMRIAVELEYDGPNSRHYGPEKFTLDLSAYGPALQPDKNLHDLVGQTEQLNRSMEKIEGHLRVLASD